MGDDNMSIKCTVTTDLQAKDKNGYSGIQKHVKHDENINPELFIPSKKVVSFHVFQKLTAFDLAYYVLRL